jgi:hypothetical protein
MVAKSLWRSLSNVAKGCQQPSKHLQEDCPVSLRRGYLFASEKHQIQIKNQEAADTCEKIT